jgi:hypothetical protein
MKNTLRALLSVSALALLLTAAPVLAAETSFTGENHKTGADSTNENLLDAGDRQGSDVTLTNNGHVNNTASATADTGHNTQTENTSTNGAGDPTTGDVDASTDWQNMVNQNSSLCDCLLGGRDSNVDADFLNELTGFHSTNRNVLNVDDNGDVRLTNAADILNSLSLTANTGYNDQTRNTMAGDITTGGVSVDSMISNEANNSDGSSSGSNTSSVSVTSENNTTGANSTNENIVNANHNGNTRVTNTARLTNTIAVNADTGHNTQDRNTKAGDIRTGDVSVATDIRNVANSGNTCCVVGGRSTDVTVDSRNDTTGADSTNRNTVNVNDNGNTTVTNNATVNNTLAVSADTGHNDQTRNTVAGEVETGSVSIDFSATNEVNSQ